MEGKLAKDSIIKELLIEKCSIVRCDAISVSFVFVVKYVYFI